MSAASLTLKLLMSCKRLVKVTFTNLKGPLSKTIKLIKV